MSNIREQILEVTEQLQKSEQLLIFEIVNRFLSEDTASPDEIKAIHMGREEFIRGETASHDDIDWS